MANTVYNNFYLSNEIEDQYNSHLDLVQFCTVDNSLVGTAGMIRKINVYSATSGTEILSVGSGNSLTIEVTYTPETYTIKLAQNRFSYYDEQALQDDMLIPTGTRRMASDMFNTVNADVYTELKKATLSVTTSTLNFDAFADAVALLNIEERDDFGEIFALINPKDVGKLRKALKDTLQYVEAFARVGYIGSVCGVNVYSKKDATEGTIVVANREAVTLFNKLGTEVEVAARGADEANTRSNTIFSRKYYLAALTDATKAVKIIVSSSST